MKTRKTQSREKFFKPQELIKYVRQNSPFYKNLYKDLPTTAKLQDLPVTPQEKFWAANHIPANQVLTKEHHNGIVLRSGGTTGNPKFSLYSNQEWQTQIKIAGEKFAQNYIEDQDRIGNLFFAGSMYGSFIFATQFIAQCPRSLIHVPIAGHTPISEIIQIIKDFKIDVLMGVPTLILNIADYLKKVKTSLDPYQIKKVFYAGDFFFKDQEDFVTNIFPDAQIFPISYASADAGLIGYYDQTCNKNEYRVFDGHIHLEIVDEKTHKVIEKENQEGLLVVTNLFRSLMPTIRYPTGDRGMWIERKERKNRKFELLGRSDEAARIGGIKFYVQDVRKILSPYQEQLQIIDFQMVTYRKNHHDCLVLRIASLLDSDKLDRFSERIIQQLISTRPETEIGEFKDVEPLEIEWIDTSELKTSPRTGKIQRVIDTRK